MKSSTLANGNPIEPIFVDLWFLFLPTKNTQLLSCPERPFLFGPMACRPVSTMLSLYEGRNETGDIDLSLQSTDDMETITLKAHKHILMASSDVFFKMLDPTGNFTESKTLNVTLPPVTINAANLFQRFIYTGHFGKNQLGRDENQEFTDIFDLLFLGHYYAMNDLKDACEKGMMYYIKRDSVSPHDVEDQIFYPLNTLNSSDLEISYVIYLSLLLYGLLKVDNIKKAIEYSYSEHLQKQFRSFKEKPTVMCLKGPATCDYCRLIQNKLTKLRFTDMFI